MAGRSVRLQFDGVIFEEALKILVLEIVERMVGKNYSEGFNRYIKSEGFVHRVSNTAIGRAAFMIRIKIWTPEDISIRELTYEEKVEVLGKTLVLLFKRNIRENDFEERGYFKIAESHTLEEALINYVEYLIFLFTALEKDFRDILRTSSIAKIREIR